ncbi:MAG: ribosomal L7Ae/L30e/S12e/Gadd45 family protein [Candidatus Woesearchaeota archaeon]|jgi:large subunit ribosomal protein L30e
MDEIKKLLGSDKLIIGKDETMKALRNGKLKKVFLASNADPNLVKDIEYYKDIASLEVVTINLTNEEVGAMCRKPFFISTLGVLK